jgi:phenylalanyl-tRNA synthetase alpha chain
LSQVFHDIEKKIINSLKENSIQSPETLEKSTQLSPDQVRRGIEWLKLKDLAIVDESKSSVISLGKNGLDSFEKGLPERRLLNLVKIGLKLHLMKLFLKQFLLYYLVKKLFNKLEVANYLKINLIQMI